MALGYSSKVKISSIVKTGINVGILGLAGSYFLTESEFYNDPAYKIWINRMFSVFGSAVATGFYVNSLSWWKRNKEKSPRGISGFILNSTPIISLLASAAILYPGFRNALRNGSISYEDPEKLSQIIVGFLGTAAGVFHGLERTLKPLFYKKILMRPGFLEEKMIKAKETSIDSHFIKSKEHLESELESNMKTLSNLSEAVDYNPLNLLFFVPFLSKKISPIKEKTSYWYLWKALGEVREYRPKKAISLLDEAEKKFPDLNLYWDLKKGEIFELWGKIKKASQENSKAALIMLEKDLEKDFMQIARTKREHFILNPEKGFYPSTLFHLETGNKEELERKYKIMKIWSDKYGVGTPGSWGFGWPWWFGHIKDKWVLGSKHVQGETLLEVLEKSETLEEKIAILEKTSSFVVKMENVGRKILEDAGIMLQDPISENENFYLDRVEDIIFRNIKEYGEAKFNLTGKDKMISGFRSALPIINGIPRVYYPDSHPENILLSKYRGIDSKYTTVIKDVENSRILPVGINWHSFLSYAEVGVPENEIKRIFNKMRKESKVPYGFSSGGVNAETSLELVGVIRHLELFSFGLRDWQYATDREESTKRYENAVWHLDCAYKKCEQMLKKRKLLSNVEEFLRKVPEGILRIKK